MKKTIKNGLLVGAICLSSFVDSFSQVKEIWTKDLPGGFAWQKVYASGNYLVANAEGLSKVNPESGKSIWTLKLFNNIAIENVEELPGSSFISVKKEEVTYLLDPFTGEIKFDSKNAGITELIDKVIFYQSNTLFLSGKDINKKPIVLLVDINKGQILWKKQEEYEGIISINELSKTEFILVTVLNNYKINILNGNVVWKNAISAESEKISGMGGALGGLVKSLANSVNKNDIVVKYYENTSKTIFVLGVEKKEDRLSPDGKSTITSYKNAYNAYNVSNGQRLWTAPVEMDGKIGQCTFYNENFIVMPHDEDNVKVNMFDLKVGNGLWGKKGKGTKLKGGVVNSYLSGDKILVVTSKNDKNLLYVIDVNTGMPLADKPTKIMGDITQTFPTAKGILYVTTDEVNVVDNQTGTLVFENAIYSNPTLTKVKDDKLFIYNKSEGKIVSVDLKTCALSTISTKEVYANGKETFTALEIREKGFVLTSSQNIAFISTEGAVVFNKYYPAPKESGLMKALLYAQAARAAYIGVRSAQASNAFQEAASQSKSATGQQVYGAFGNAYGDYSKQATGFALQSLQQAQSRYKASSQGRDFVIILTDADRGNVLAVINKNTGELIGEVNLGKEKSPKYTVDDIGGQIFMENKKGNIVSYKLN